MGMTITYNFTNPLNYTYDNTKISISANLAKLLLQSASLPFIQPFTSDVGFTYDNTKAEFVGGKVQQKDQRPANSILGATYTNNANLSWAANGFVDLTPTLNGSPTVTGGKLVCPNGANGLHYSDASIGNLSGNLYAKWKFTPGYSGAPGTNTNIFAIGQSSGIINQIVIFHSPAGGTLRLTCNGLSAAILGGAWNPVAGTEYTFELRVVSNVVNLFVDNVQYGGNNTISPGQGTNADHVFLGAYPTTYNTTNGSFNDLILYSTASQTPIYTVPENTYVSTNVILPEMEHTGDGSILAFDNFSTVDSGSPRYILQIGRSGDYLYWNGAAWVVSNETYAQANDELTFNANVGSLPVSGEKYGQFMVLFTDSNTISDVDTLTATMTVNNGYLTTNPSLLTNSGFRADQLLAFSAVETKTGLDEIKYTLLKDNVDYYWNGTAWAVSNGTYSQANTATEINTNKSSFLIEGSGKNIKIRPFLHSETGDTTPSLTSFTLEYDFSGELPTLNTITIWGYLRDLLTYVEGELIQVKPAWTIGDKTIIEGVYVDVQSSTLGYFEIDTVIEDVEPTYLIWKIGKKVYKTNFLNQPTVKFSELTIIEQNGG